MPNSKKQSDRPPPVTTKPAPEIVQEEARLDDLDKYLRDNPGARAAIEHKRRT